MSYNPGTERTYISLSKNNSHGSPQIIRYVFLSYLIELHFFPYMEEYKNSCLPDMFLKKEKRLHVRMKQRPSSSEEEGAGGLNIFLMVFNHMSFTLSVVKNGLSA